ncbi:MAG: CvpA family protein [Burkholderiaceae bacterium]|jgi:membrane protein required for colicin V production
MTVFDYVVVGVIVISVVVSAMRGLVREVLSLIVWVLAFCVANYWAADVAALLPEAVPNPMLRLIIGFLILLVLTLLVGAFVNVLVLRLIRTARLELADHGLGGLFGFARGILIVLTGVILAGLTSLPQQPAWRNAVLAPLAVEGVRTVKPLLPQEWARYVHY